MKILVQNCHTHQYLKAPSDWTPDVNHATDFGNSERALAFCTEHRIPAVQIVLKFDYERYDVKLPITEECKEADNGHAAGRLA